MKLIKDDLVAVVKQGEEQEEENRRKRTKLKLNSERGERGGKNKKHEGENREAMTNFERSREY